MKLAVLCAEPSALVCLEALAAKHTLVDLGLPELPKGMLQPHLDYAAMHGLEVVSLPRVGLGQALSGWFSAGCHDVFLMFGCPWKLPLEPFRQLRHGAFNVHSAPLPQYRGPQPQFWLVREQATEGGVTVHRVDESFDTGPIALRRSISISPADTLGLHLSKLAAPSAEAALELLQHLERGDLTLEPQDEKRARYWPPPDSYDLTVDWEQDASARIAALVRAANPFHGGAATSIREQPLHLLQVSTGPLSSKAPPPGTILEADPQRGLIAASVDQSWVRADIVSVREGIFTGDVFVSRFGIRPGERFI